jgi:DNA-directed RNA polymerase specialized sigma24 family protein
MDGDPRSDGELLVAASSEDPDAFATFYRRHVRGLLALFKRQAGSTEVALDLTAETFAARSRERRGMSYGRSQLVGGCTGSPGTSCRGSASRREDRVRRALGMAPIVLTDEGIERIEKLAAASAFELLEGLPTDQRDAVRARVLEGRSYAEIAEQLGCSPSVVRKRVSRGVQAMRAKMEASGDE